MKGYKPEWKKKLRDRRKPKMDDGMAAIIERFFGTDWSATKHINGDRTTTASEPDRTGQVEWK